MDTDFIALFPNLSDSNYQNTSPRTREYNCIAWAANDSSRWWEPAPTGAGYYWPVSGITEPSIENGIAAFKQLGFSKTTNLQYEEGYERIAVYEQDGEYTHAARQLPSGKWFSKMGALEDIEHNTLEGLVGAEYGTVHAIMRRKL